MYTHAFLRGLDYTENCYSCQYARWNRVSDITLGDSWGSELETEEQAKGISLILCQTAKGRELVSRTEITTKPVDIEKAIRSNQQLIRPTEMHKNRRVFLNILIRDFIRQLKNVVLNFIIRKSSKRFW